MCHDTDGRPPIAPIAGAAGDTRRITLEAGDGASTAAFLARSSTPTAVGIVILPDVRGLHPFYEELALRFAENGVDALVVDYFGRTAPPPPRPADFDHVPHVEATTWAGQSADIRAAADYLRSGEDARTEMLFSVGFCFGGRTAFLSATLGLDLAGAIGFYGPPTGPGRNDAPAPVEVAAQFGSPVLGLFGGGDPSIPADAVRAFGDALDGAGILNRLVVFEGAPHSFFDRKAADFADVADRAWATVLEFIDDRAAAVGVARPSGT